MSLLTVLVLEFLCEEEILSKFTCTFSITHFLKKKLFHECIFIHVFVLFICSLSLFILVMLDLYLIVMFR